MVIISSILLAATELFARNCSDAPPGKPEQGMCCFTFTGEASGGTLIFCEYQGGKANKYATVETTVGESSEKVISRLADVIDQTNPFGWGIVRSGPRETWKRVVTSSGGELKLPGACGWYIIAGTEIGLNIPQPPYSLTCNYAPETNTIAIRWINPSPNEYDSIRISFHKYIGGITLPGKSESYEVNLNDYSYSKVKDSELGYYMKIGMTPKDALSNIASDLVIWVYGVRNDIPSNAAVMHLNNNIQEELYGVPFTSGIAPNWQPWALDTNEGKIRLAEGIRKEYTKITTQGYDPVKTPETKPFYQVINTGAKGGTGGVFRKFIGLTPGHTYRVKTRVATLSEPNEKNGSVSVHAAPNSPDKRDFIPRQMAGLDALSVPEAAIKVGTAHSTGQFAEISTGHTIDGQEIKDITLPPRVDSITVWVKCAGPAGLSAAIDWISLEDLSVQKP